MSEIMKYCTEGCCSVHVIWFMHTGTRTFALALGRIQKIDLCLRFVYMSESPTHGPRTNCFLHTHTLYSFTVLEDTSSSLVFGPGLHSSAGCVTKLMENQSKYKSINKWHRKRIEQWILSKWIWLSKMAKDPECTWSTADTHSYISLVW